MQACFRAYLRSRSFGPRCQPAIVDFLLKESQKGVIATSNAFVLLEWACLVQEEMVRDKNFFDASFARLCPAAASLLNKVEDESTRASVKHSALVIARRGMRVVLRDQEIGPKALALAIKELASASSSTGSNAPYLGVVSGVSARIPARKAEMQELRKQILDFYVKHVLNSKVPISYRQALGMKDFFLAFVNLQDLSDAIFPAIEKSILRSGEIVLQGPIIALAQSLGPELDILPLVQAKLLKPLLSSLNSANAKIRDGAGQTLIALLSRGGDAESMSKIATELGAAIKATKSSNSDLRALLADALSVLTADDKVALTLTQPLVLTAAKETNELALKKELAALSSHLPVLVQAGRIDKALADSIIKSSNDKRPLFRKSWHLALASTLTNLKFLPKEGPARDFVSSALDLLKQVHKEIAPNPLPATQTGLVAAAFALPGLIGSEVVDMSGNLVAKDALLAEAFATKLGPSYLCNPKVYTKLTTVEDLRWVLRALVGVAAGLKSADDSSKTMWARALFHLLLGSDVDPSVRREAASSLAQLYRHNPAAVGQSIVLGAWHFLKDKQQLATAALDEACPLADVSFLNALRLVLSPTKETMNGSTGPSTDVFEDQAIDTVVLLRPELIAHADWIAMCLSRGMDPGQLVTHSIDRLFQQILSCFGQKKSTPLQPIEVAACNAAASLAFVAPEVATPRLIQQFSSDLETSQLADIGPTEAAIARTPDGVLVVDVLAQKPNGYVENKNRKDYDILKWDEEIRTQLAQKKGAQKKLTPEQQAKVDAQLKYEATVREKVQEMSVKLRRGAGLIHGLATGPPTEPRTWMSAAIDTLTAALKAGAALVVDNELVLAYLACADKVADRLGTMRPFIGIATIRALRSASLPDDLAAEPLSELATRVLYRLRFAAEQRPFDTASLAYALPLIFSVLDNNGVGEGSQEDKDAQVLLALEFLSYQMSSCDDAYLPRADILRYLISAMQKYPQHHRIIKDSLMEFCKAIADTLTVPEREILLASTTVPEVAVRTAVLQGIQAELDLNDAPPSVNIWIACQDEEDENADTALAIWEENEFEVTAELVRAIPAFLYDTSRSVRLSASKALAQALSVQTSETESIVEGLEQIYKEESLPLKPKANKLGIVQKGDLADPWQRRSGLALAFMQLASVLEKSMIVPILEFFVSQGPVADRHSSVRAEMVEAGKAVVEVRGSECLEPLMKVFEDVLQKPDQKTPEYDWTNEATIVLYGSLAQHLPDSDKRINDVISKLTATLSTPSENVQYAVAMCLPPLVRSKSLDAGQYITSLLEQLLQGKQYAARRGAAYGLAGIIRGKGVSALRQFRIMSALKTASGKQEKPTKSTRSDVCVRAILSVTWTRFRALCHRSSPTAAGLLWRSRLICSRGLPGHCKDLLLKLELFWGSQSTPTAPRGIGRLAMEKQEGCM